MKKLSLNKLEEITNRENKSFSKYLLEISAIDILDADEEYELAILMKGGDEKALELLVLHNLRFVVSVAKQYVTPTLKLEDLVNEGNEGLFIGAKRFDPTRGFKFISYGVWWIRRSILAYISEHSRTIRIPNNKNNIMYKLKSRCEILEQELEHIPTLAEMVNELSDEFSTKDIIFYHNNETSNIVSLDAPVINDGPYQNEIAGDYINSGVHSMEEIIENDYTKFIVRKLLDALPKENHKKVLIMIFGLNGEEPLTLKSVGLKLGLTSERVRQIRDIALSKLKAIIKEK